MSLDLLLLPGLNNTPSVFDGVVSALPATVRVHCPSLPALSTVESIAQQVLHDAPARFWLAGFSFGGYVALAVLAAAPERVAGMSLICSLPKTDSPAQASRRLAFIAQAQAGGYESLATSTALPFHPDNRQNQDLLARRLQMVRQYGAERFIAHCQACIARPDRSLLLDGRRPTLLVTASHDEVVPTAEVRALGESLPEARLVVVDGAGHLLPMEQPPALACALTDWMGMRWAAPNGLVVDGTAALRDQAIRAAR